MKSGINKRVNGAEENQYNSHFDISTNVGAVVKILSDTDVDADWVKLDDCVKTLEIDFE